MTMQPRRSSRQLEGAGRRVRRVEGESETRPKPGTLGAGTPSALRRHKARPSGGAGHAEMPPEPRAPQDARAMSSSTARPSARRLGAVGAALDAAEGAALLAVGAGREGGDGGVDVAVDLVGGGLQRRLVLGVGDGDDGLEEGLVHLGDRGKSLRHGVRKAGLAVDGSRVSKEPCSTERVRRT